MEITDRKILGKGPMCLSEGPYCLDKITMVNYNSNNTAIHIILFAAKIQFDNHSEVFQTRFELFIFNVVRRYNDIP
jgi:hypothetical protein